MARTLNLADRRLLRAALLLALLLHVVVLIWARFWLRPPSLIENLPPPFYTRVLLPSAAPEAAPTAASARATARVTQRRRPRHATHGPGTAVALAADALPPDASASDASAPLPDVSDAAFAAAAASAASSASDAASAAMPDAAFTAASAAASAASPAAAASTPGDAVASAAVAAAPDSVASAAPPAFIDNWPPNTRLTYELTGRYRGELHGSAQLLWQRLFDGQRVRYQTEVKLGLGLLLSMRLASQGEVTEDGLAPEVYEEQIGSRQRHVRIGQDVLLNNGKHAPRPDDVQDTASQFIELAHRLAANPARLVPGGSVHIWLARPTGVDEWVYDVLGEETLYLPRLGQVRAFHLKPRPLNQPSGAISAEIWFAPSLQYLPVRILLTQDESTAVNLTVDAITQQ